MELQVCTAALSLDEGRQTDSLHSLISSCATLKTAELLCQSLPLTCLSMKRAVACVGAWASCAKGCGLGWQLPCIICGQWHVGWW
jgi:hypothetical protein